MPVKSQEKENFFDKEKLLAHAYPSCFNFDRIEVCKKTWVEFWPILDKHKKSLELFEDRSKFREMRGKLIGNISPNIFSFEDNYKFLTKKVQKESSEQQFYKELEILKSTHQEFKQLYEMFPKIEKINENPYWIKMKNCFIDNDDQT